MVKLVGLGFYQYFDDSWNIFDFTLVVLSLVGDFIDLGTIATLFRVFRVARVFRIVRTSKGLHNLFKTLILSIPNVFNVSMVVILIHIIFAVMAMNLFSSVKHQDLLNRHANFEGFGISMLTVRFAVPASTIIYFTAMD